MYVCVCVCVCVCVNVCMYVCIVYVCRLQTTARASIASGEGVRGRAGSRFGLGSWDWDRGIGLCWIGIVGLGCVGLGSWDWAVLDWDRGIGLCVVSVFPMMVELVKWELGGSGPVTGRGAGAVGLCWVVGGRGWRVVLWLMWVV